MNGKIDKLIINSPYKEPEYHWHYIREKRVFEKREGRRPAGYIVSTPHSQSFDDPGIFVPIELVEKIRPRVRQWCLDGYPGITGVTKRLLNHWYDSEERKDSRFFFCQLEAIETLIWLAEAPESQKVGINIPSDGGEFIRWCCKMATGSGKTVVMAMLIAWNILNKLVNPRDTRFSKNILIIAPGLTVRNRLSVLYPSNINNYYEGNYGFKNVITDFDEIRFKLDEGCFGEIVIYNMKGEKIRTLFSDEINGNEVMSVTWDGKDEAEKEVSSGLYFYQLETAEKSYTKKMLLLK